MALDIRSQLTHKEDNQKIRILWLSEDDMVEAGVLDVGRAVDVMEEVVGLLEDGDAIMGGPDHDQHGMMLYFPKHSDIPGYVIQQGFLGNHASGSAVSFRCLARCFHAKTVKYNDIRGFPGYSIKYLRKPVFRNRIVRVYPCNIVSLRKLQTGVSRSGYACVILVNAADKRIFLRIGITYFRTAVGRAVIHQNHFNISVSSGNRRYDAVETLGKIPCAVIDRNDYRQNWALFHVHCIL